MGGTTLGTIRLALLLTVLGAEPLDFGPGLELIGGAWSCWTRLEARLLLEVLEVAEVRPPSRSRTVLRDFLFTVWIPEGLFAELLPGLAPVGVEGRGPPGGLPITFGDGRAGKACWAMM